MSDPCRSGKRLLQVTVAVLGLVPVVAGGTGIALGPAAIADMALWPVDLDSHYRYMSGIFLALGLAFYATIPDIERKTVMFRVLGAMVFAGGLSRLLSLLIVGLPSWPHVAGLILELIVVPLLVFWQARVARHGPTTDDG